MTVKTTIPEAPRPDTRESRALALYRARRRDIVLVGRDTYEVPSQDGERVYEVRYGGDEESCTCPDHQYRGENCVHILAVAIYRAKRRGATARRLAAVEDALAHELLDDEARMELRDEILRLEKRAS